MRLFGLLCGLMLTTFFATFGNAQAAVEVKFGPNQKKAEAGGNVSVTLMRTGILNVTTSVMYWEDWSNATMQPSELLFNPHIAPKDIIYNGAGRFATVTFRSGVKKISIPYSISNDQEVEGDEWVDFKVISAGSSSGTTTIGNRNVRTTIIDDDKPPVFVGVYAGTITDEGQETRSFMVLSEPTTRDVSLRVSTYYGTYREANYPVQDDYQGLVGKLVTIRAGTDFAWVPIQIHQNPDPSDAPYEKFELCIDNGSVSGAVVNVACAELVIKDIPLPKPVVIAPNIFDNSLGAGWRNTSWGVSIKPLAKGYNGTNSIQAIFAHDWAGLAFSANGFDTTSYDTLSFAIKANSSHSGNNIMVAIYLANGSVYSRPLTGYLTNGSLVPDKWNVVHVPLLELNAANKLVNQVVIESGAAGTLLIDELSFLPYAGDCE